MAQTDFPDKSGTEKHGMDSELHSYCYFCYFLDNYYWWVGKVQWNNLPDNGRVKVPHTILTGIHRLPGPGYILDVSWNWTKVWLYVPLYKLFQTMTGPIQALNILIRDRLRIICNTNEPLFPI